MMKKPHFYIPDKRSLESQSKSPIRASSKISTKTLVLVPMKIPRSGFIMNSLCSSHKSRKKSNISSSLTFTSAPEGSNSQNDLFYDNDTLLISSLVTKPKINYFVKSPQRARRVLSFSKPVDISKTNKKIKKSSIGLDPYSTNLNLSYDY